jgi:hypothetical protein
MLSWAILWDVVKVAVFPVIGILYAMFRDKLRKQDEAITKIQDDYDTLNRTMIKMEATFVTQEQLQKLFGDLLVSMEKGNDVLERRLEKTMDLKIDPLKDMLTKLVDKH